jgi:hypothetical protein
VLVTPCGKGKPPARPSLRQDERITLKKGKVNPVDTTSQIILAIAGLVIGILQTVIISMLADMRQSIDRTWKRINNHYHEVECSNVDCRTLRTGNVILPRGSE